MAHIKDGCQPEPGDLLEIFRPGYQHWVLYVGGGYVIHMVPPSEVPGAGFGSMGSVTCDKATVKKELLKNVVGSDRYCVNNKLDQKYKPLPVGKVIQAAELLVDHEVPYSLITRNCEHWVSDMRYGKPESRQIRTLVMAGIWSTMGTLALAAVVSYFAGERRDQKTKQ